MLADPMQLVDELSMIYTACKTTWIQYTTGFSTSPESENVPGTLPQKLASFLHSRNLLKNQS